MKLHEIKQTILKDKFYVYDLDTHKIVSGPHDQQLHAANSPKMAGAEKGQSFVVKQGKDIQSPDGPPGLAEAKLQTVELNDIDIWDEHGLQEADIEVEFHYEEPSYSDHPYGEGTARENHGAVIDIYSVKLLNDVDVLDMDDNVMKVLPKGTDLMKEKTPKGLPIVSKKNITWLEDQVEEKMLG